jgi:hypothetical protein
MLAQRIGCFLHTRQCSLRTAQFEQRLEDFELPDSCPPLFLGNGDQIRSLGWTLDFVGQCFSDWNTFEPAFTVFLRDVIVSIPSESTTAKRRLRQRIMVPGTKPTENAIVILRDEFKFSKTPEPDLTGLKMHYKAFPPFATSMIAPFANKVVTNKSGTARTSRR